jgi:hypothetical protein
VYAILNRSNRIARYSGPPNFATKGSLEADNSPEKWLFQAHFAEALAQSFGGNNERIGQHFRALEPDSCHNQCLVVCSRVPKGIQWSLKCFTLEIGWHMINQRRNTCAMSFYSTFYDIEGYKCVEDRETAVGVDSYLRGWLFILSRHPTVGALVLSLKGYVCRLYIYI